jgi:anti-sigma regulatory factor (Ser/Thr protein kinase)
MQIAIPAMINADGLLPFLAVLDKPLSPEEEVVLDFSGLRRVTPAGLVGLVATVLRWRRENHPVAFRGLQTCPITGYLQRMDEFTNCKVELPENFRRHDAKGRFVPVQAIDHRVDEMGHALSKCLAPGGEDYGHAMANLYDLAWYVFTETANNVRQHSRESGWVSAQVNSDEGLVRLALADNGCGILKSFEGIAWSVGMSDAEAIQEALKPRVSSKGTPTNEGVGLTLVSGLVRRIKGWLLIVSGTGVLKIRAGEVAKTEVLPEAAHYQGTLVGLTFRQRDVVDYASLLENAKIDAGLLQRANNVIRFRL